MSDHCQAALRQRVEQNGRAECRARRSSSAQQPGQSDDHWRSTVSGGAKIERLTTCILARA